MRKRFIDIQEMPVVTPEEQAQQRAETEAELTAATQEHTERYEEVSSAMDDVEKAFVAHDAVNTVADEVEKTIEVGGMPVEAANAVTAAVEALRINLGFRKNSSPALESFGKGEDRVAATKVALEGLKDTAAKIWEAIKKALAKLVDWVKALFSSQARREQAVKKKVDEALKELEKELVGASSEEKEVRGTRKWRPALLAKGKPPTVADIEKQLAQNDDLVKWSADFGKLAGASILELEQLSGKSDQRYAKDAIFRNLISHLKSIPHGIVHTSSDMLSVEVSLHLGGGKLIGEATSGGTNNESISFKLDNGGAAAEPVMGDDLAFSESMRILGHLNQRASATGVAKELDKALDKINGLIARAQNKGYNPEDSDELQDIKELLHASRSIVRTALNAITAIGDMASSFALEATCVGF